MKGLTSELNIIRQYSDPLLPVPSGIVQSLTPLDIDVILFDIYGTLFVSVSGDINSTLLPEDKVFIKILNESGFSINNRSHPDLSSVTLLHRIKGAHSVAAAKGIPFPEVDILKIWEDILKDWLKKGIIFGDISEDKLRRLAIIYEMHSNPIWPMPGLPDLFSALKCSYPLGIISNAQFYTPLLFEAFFHSPASSLGFIDSLTFYSYCFGKSKPDPFLFEKAAESAVDIFNTTADKILFVGNDMKKDIFPAFSAGMKTALFAGDKRSLRLYEEDDILLECKPSVILTDLSQILDILK